MKRLSTPAPSSSVSINVSTSALRTVRRSLLALSMCGVVSSQAGEVEVVAQVASDWMYHGTTETDGNPAAGLVIDWQATEHSFVGVEVHQAEVDGRPQRHRSVAVYAGTGRRFGEHWFASALVSHREFPKSVKEWDFTEFGLKLDHSSGWGVSFDFSPDYYEHNTRSYATELRYRRELGRSLYAYGSLGAIEFEDPVFVDYRFGQLGMGWRVKRVVLDLSYRANSEGDDASFGRAAYSQPKLVGQLVWRLR